MCRTCRYVSNYGHFNFTSLLMSPLMPTLVVYVVQTPKQAPSALLCSLSCKFLGKLEKYKSKKPIQNSDRRVLRRQQASAETQSLFICSLKEQVSPCNIYFSLVVNNGYKDLLQWDNDERATTKDCFWLFLLLFSQSFKWKFCP